MSNGSSLFGRLIKTRRDYRRWLFVSSERLVKKRNFGNMLLLSVALIAIGLFGDHCSAAPFEDEHEKWQPAKSCSEIYTQSELNFDEVSDVVTQRKTKYRNINVSEAIK